MKKLNQILLVICLISITFQAKSQTATFGSLGAISDTVTKLYSKNTDLYIGTISTVASDRFVKTDGTNISTLGYSGIGNKIVGIGSYGSKIVVYDHGLGTNGTKGLDYSNGSFNQTISIGAGGFNVKAIETNLSNTEVIVAGYFTSISAPYQTISSIYNYNGTASTAGNNFTLGASANQRQVNDLTFHNSELYAVGYFGSSKTVQKLDAFNNWSILTPINIVNSVAKAAISYNNTLYLIYEQQVTPGIFKDSLYKFDGTSLTNLGIGSATKNGLNCLEVFNGKLYIGGDKLVSYDGTSSTTIIPSFTSGGFINSINVFGNKLAFGGAFSEVNGNTSLSKLAYLEFVNAPVAVFTTNNTSTCIGTSISVTNSSTGTGPITYLWSATGGATFSGSTTSSNPGTITFTTAGIQTITLTTTNSGGSNSYIQNVTVNTLPTPSITASSSTTFCYGGSVDLSTTLSYSAYSWSNNPTSQINTVSGNGNYNVTVTDANGCEGISNSIQVTVNTLPTPNISGTLSYCKNDSTQLNTSSYSTYTWNNGAIVQNPYVTSGTYNVTVTDVNGCSGTSSIVTVVENALPTPVITLTGSDLKSSALVGNQWYKDAVILAGETNQFYSPITNGVYTVEVTDANTCIGLSPGFNMTNLGVEENKLDSNVFSYTNGNLTIYQGEWKLLDLSGRIIQSGNEGSFLIPLGVYILQSDSGSKRITHFN